MSEPIVLGPWNVNSMRVGYLHFWFGFCAQLLELKIKFNKYVLNELIESVYHD